MNQVECARKVRSGRLVNQIVACSGVPDLRALKLQNGRAFAITRTTHVFYERTAYPAEAGNQTCFASTVRGSELGARAARVSSLSSANAGVTQTMSRAARGISIFDGLERIMDFLFPNQFLITAALINSRASITSSLCGASCLSFW